MTLANAFLHDLQRFSLTPYLIGQPVVVAVSGGADSLCLLHLLHRTAADYQTTLHVATLNHGLRGSAGQADAEFVVETARAWDLPVHRARMDVAALANQHRMGIEEAARRARYTFLARVAHETGSRAIAVGHHADDQAETLLLHLIRGSGLAGLRGMQPLTPLTAGHLLPGAEPPAGLVLLRPLLAIARADIDCYCAEHGLLPRQDATNTELAYLRNRIRHEVLPLLESLNPGIRQALTRTASLVSDDYTKLEQDIQREAQRMLRQEQAGLITLDLTQFRQPDLETAIRRGVLRVAVERLLTDVREIGFATVEQAMYVALHGHTGNQAILPGGIVLQVGYDRLTLRRPLLEPPSPSWPSIPADAPIAVSVPGTTTIPGSDWTLHARWLAADEDPAPFNDRPFTATLSVPEGTTLAIRTRRPGDRFMPLGMGGHSRKLKELLIDLKLPAAQRDSLPLLIVDWQIAWIPLAGPSRIAEPLAIHLQTKNKLLLWWSQEIGQ